MEPVDDISEVVELEPGMVIDSTDVDTLLRASGRVSGAALPNGFFLRTDEDQVFFVETAQTVTSGDRIEVRGRVASTASKPLHEWEADAFEGGVPDPDWDVWRDFHLVDGTVTRR